MIECLKMAGALFVIFVGVGVAVIPCLVVMHVMLDRLDERPVWVAVPVLVGFAFGYTALLTAAMMCLGIVS